MKAIRILVTLFLVLGFLEVNDGHRCCAQTPAKTLTLLYSNNINGEIDPCPS